MELSQLLKGIAEYNLHGDGSGRISGLTCDSRKVLPGTLFFALRGATVDGHCFIPAAVRSGAVAVVLEDAACAPQALPWVQVADGRAAMALMAAEFHGNP